MKFKLATLLLAVSLSAFAFDHTYDVYGEDELGRELEGSIYTTNGQREVHGELTDSNGHTVEFYGQWEGTGEISGETENGLLVDLYTQ